MELIHTCYRITDVERSVAFYGALGFEERRRLPIRDEAITLNAILGLALILAGVALGSGVFRLARREAVPATPRP